jgi:TRAP-type C4-dicarboxylate transport system substrate-binding protein
MRNLVLHNFYPHHRAESFLLDQFASDTERLSDGTVQVKVAHANKLGLDDAAGLDWLSAGKVDLALLWAVHLQQREPSLRSAYIMGSARTLDEHMRALPLLERLNGEILAERGVVPIAYFPSPILYISVFANRTPITSLASFAGRRLRVFSQDLEPTFRRLGVDATFIPQNELYRALETDRFDCTIYPACHTAWSVPLWRVTQHAAYLFPEALQPYVLAAPRTLWESLSGEEREAIQEASRLRYQDFLRLSIDPTAELAARRNLEAAGVQWHPDFAAADQKSFVESASKTWSDMTAEVGERLSRHRREVLGAMGR